MRINSVYGGFTLRQVLIREFMWLISLSPGDPTQAGQTFRKGGLQRNVSQAETWGLHSSVGVCAYCWQL